MGFTRNARVESHTLRLSKVGAIPITWSRELPAVPNSVTIIKDYASRYVASFVVVVEREPLPLNGNAVGVDPGWASLAVTSDGVKIAPPKLLRTALGRIRKLQRSPSCKARYSNNHATVADQRLDPLHRLGTGLIREHRTVWIEDLNVAGMVKNRKLARSIADVGWRLLRTLLAPKARMDGPTVQVVSRWQPTSWTCSACGHRHGNTACNVPSAALAARVNAWGAERKTSGLASGSEAGTHLNQECRNGSLERRHLHPLSPSPPGGEDVNLVNPCEP